MSFHTGVTETILFDEWRTTNWVGMGWSMLGVVLLGAIYEGLKSYREHIFVSADALKKRCEKKSRKELLFSGLHLFQTVMHIVQMLLGYFLMLIFMTYNIWICIALLVGSGIGYWLFAWQKSNDDYTEDCCT